jgi:hypothetical protein
VNLAASSESGVEEGGYGFLGGGGEGDVGCSCWDAGDGVSRFWWR